MLPALAFGAGIGAVYSLPTLPTVGQTLLGLGLLLVLSWGSRHWRLIAPACLGSLWGLLYVSVLLSDPFPDALARSTLVIEGQVASIPAGVGGAKRFLFRVDEARLKGKLIHFKGLVRLGWYQEPPEIHVGERWRLPVRLKPRHGYANPGGFDAERWLFEQGVKAKGYVRRGAEAERLAAGPGAYRLDRWRERFAEHMAAVLGDSPSLGLIQALVLGETGGMDRDDWDVFAITGTSHLVAISGMNVWLIAGIALGITRWLWSRSERLVILMAAPRAGALAGIAGAWAYSALAGFSVSTQRALVMAVVVLAALFLQRTLRPWHALGVALVGVLLVDPGAVISFGFWLSFVAVALLVFALGNRLPIRDVWTGWLRAQWVVTVGLLPLLIFFFGRVSVVSPLVNLIAVPAFTLLLFPLVLSASFLSLIPSLELPLLLTADLLDWCMQGLRWIAALPQATAAAPIPPLWVWSLSGLGVVLVLAPRGLPGRWLGVVLAALLFLWRPHVPAPGEALVTVLDVGQGLSVVVQTAGGVMVFDTGPAYPGGFDTGRAVLAPFLLSRGIERVDTLVVSHADRDHAGGAEGAAEKLAIGRILSGEPAALTLPGAEPCRAGDGWVWSGVSFRFLHPGDGSEEGNRASCVLRVEASGKALLLTGDADVQVEDELVERFGEAIQSDILIAGHHGSRTSSGASFLEKVSPDWVLFSSGYANQYRFPAREVRERVAGLGIQSLDTGLNGAIEFSFRADGGLDGPTSWRATQGHIWTHRPTGYPD